MSKQVSGIVEAVGTKFNGSVKVNGEWFSFAKGKKVDVQTGARVVMELEPWEFKGKTGMNVVSLSASAPLALKPKVAQEQQSAVDGQKAVYAGRDFDAENRGKIRHGLIVAALPLVLTDSVSLDKVKEIVPELVEYIMTGK